MAVYNATFTKTLLHAIVTLGLWAIVQYRIDQRYNFHLSGIHRILARQTESTKQIDAIDLAA